MLIVFFYYSIGEILKTFREVEKDGTGHADFDKLWEKMKTMKTSSGRNFEESEIEMLIKASAGQEKQIDLAKYINLIIRMKQFRG